MTQAILVLNAGSSSIKFSLFGTEADDGEPVAIFDGKLEGIGHEIHFVAKDAEGGKLVDEKVAGPASHEQALSTLLAWIDSRSGGIELVAAGHRVVHGGDLFAGSVRITANVFDQIKSLSPLAPQHQPHNLEAIAALRKIHPGLPQVACFDTAFHRTQPAVASDYALPRKLTADGIKGYGFHGLSYEYIASVLPQHLGEDAGGRIVVAHLGHGCSMCAIRHRQSVATTMGFSALDGLVMGQRCGSIDPGVLLYLLQERGMSPDALSKLLYEESGLLGVSGISDDMRDLLASDDPKAGEAVALFVYRIGRELGSLAAALGGIDALVFTGGIGENSPDIRRGVCLGAEWLGITLDEAANASNGPHISLHGNWPSVWVIPTNEDLVIARHTRNLLKLGAPT